MFVHPTGGPYEATMDSDDEPEADFEVASSYEGSNDSDANDMVYSVEASDARTIEHRIVVDSGASAHMTGASEHLFDTKPCNRQVVVANGNVTVATTMGKLNISTPSHTTLTLTDVLMIKGMSTTLLSIPALMWANSKVHVEFQQDACTILLGSQSVARATMNNDQRLYILDGVFNHEAAYSAVTADTTALWHHRIGHLPIEALRVCAKAGLGLPTRISDLTKPCMDCPRAKMQRVTVPKRSARTYKPGECWHSDPKGPLPVASVGGCRYYTAYIDDCTGYKIVKFIHSTNAVPRQPPSYTPDFTPAYAPDFTEQAAAEPRTSAFRPVPERGTQSERPRRQPHPNPKYASLVYDDDALDAEQERYHIMDEDPHEHETTYRLDCAKATNLKSSARMSMIS
ncbi:hypothetical protein DYB32_009769 [Aphanomyces invadans]|uniref:Uncharacterized protein n=1 Tax=Aphanomyces invadans TaxID=157072 RepID=A0A418AHT9_9STRA|nr:hypothetical protein DYB32_009769 [Aphanomyces invadans]